LEFQSRNKKSGPVRSVTIQNIQHEIKKDKDHPFIVRVNVTLSKTNS